MIVNRKDIQTQTLKKLDMNMKLPQNRYTLRCKKESFDPSKSSGNMMVTREWEIVAPESVTIEGQQVVIAGVEIKQYLPLQGSANPSKGLTAEAATANAIDRYLGENQKLGLPSDSVDTDNPTLQAENLVVEAICNAKETSPTQKPEPGQKVGKPILGLDNKPVKRYAPNLVEILGLSSVKVPTGF